jgi:hypothetical protein
MQCKDVYIGNTPPPQGEKGKKHRPISFKGESMKRSKPKRENVKERGENTKDKGKQQLNA